MNKHQEAYLKLLSTFNNMQLGINNHNTLEITQSFNIIKELVDKETPKKPKIIYSDELGYYGEKIIIEEYCPICNEELHCVGGLYCHRCGQKIDWSDEYE